MPQIALLLEPGEHRSYGGVTGGSTSRARMSSAEARLARAKIASMISRSRRVRRSTGGRPMHTPGDGAAVAAAAVMLQVWQYSATPVARQCLLKTEVRGVEFRAVRPPMTEARQFASLSYTATLWTGVSELLRSNVIDIVLPSGSNRRGVQRRIRSRRVTARHPMSGRRLFEASNT